MNETAKPFAVSGPGDLCPARRRFLFRFLAMGVLWQGLNWGDYKSWMVGAPIVLLAAWLSLRLLPEHSWRLSTRAAASFGGFFMVESLKGGWQVARLAFAGGLNPGMYVYPLRLPPGPARLFFSAVISLLPGTAVMAMDDETFTVHVLDDSGDLKGDLAKLEQRVAALFNLTLQPPGARL